MEEIIINRVIVEFEIESGERDVLLEEKLLAKVSNHIEGFLTKYFIEQNNTSLKNSSYDKIYIESVVEQSWGSVINFENSNNRSRITTFKNLFNQQESAVSKSIEEGEQFNLSGGQTNLNWNENNNSRASGGQHFTNGVVEPKKQASGFKKQLESTDSNDFLDVLSACFLNLSTISEFEIWELFNGLNIDLEKFLDTFFGHKREPYNVYKRFVNDSKGVVFNEKRYKDFLNSDNPDLILFLLLGNMNVKGLVPPKNFKIENILADRNFLLYGIYQFFNDRNIDFSTQLYKQLKYVSISELLSSNKLQEVFDCTLIETIGNLIEKDNFKLTLERKDVIVLEYVLNNLKNNSAPTTGLVTSKLERLLNRINHNPVNIVLNEQLSKTKEEDIEKEQKPRKAAINQTIDLEMKKDADLIEESQSIELLRKTFLEEGDVQRISQLLQVGTEYFNPFPSEFLLMLSNRLEPNDYKYFVAKILGIHHTDHDYWLKLIEEKYFALPISRLKKLIELSHDLHLKCAYYEEIETYAFDSIDSIKERELDNVGVLFLMNTFSFLFKKYDLLKEGRFTSIESKVRAICILYYLVRGNQIPHPSHFSVLKVIVGVAPSFNMEPHWLRFTSETKLHRELDGFLSELSYRWFKDKKVSIDFIREVFLQRPGSVELQDESFKFYMKKRTEDVLLKSFPLGYSMSKFTWSGKLVYLKLI